MGQAFKYYLHDTSQSDERRAQIESQGVQLSESAWENMGRPFYEIEFECEVDDAGNVTILSFKP